MKKIFSFLVALLAFNLATAQFLEDNQFIAKVTLKDGTVKKGVVELDPEPYRAQNSIKFFDLKLLDAGPVKNKDKEKISASEIKEIKMEDRLFEVKKYADLSAASLSSLGKYFILPVVKKGKLTLYQYSSEIGAQPELLVGKEGEEKVKAVASTSIKPFIEDCAAIKEKFEKGEYGNNPKDDSALMNENLKFIHQLLDEYNSICVTQ